MSKKINNEFIKSKYKIIVSSTPIINCMLSRKEPFGHNEGNLGWNYDAYELAPDICLCVAYRNAPVNTKTDYAYENKLVNETRKLDCFAPDYEQKLEAILDKYIAYVREQYAKTHRKKHDKGLER